MDIGDVPAGVRARHANWRWDVVWHEYPDAITFRLTAAGGEIRFMKVAQGTAGRMLVDECERMRWARRHLPVPDVIASGVHGDVTWMITSGIDGWDATHERWRDDPERLVTVLAEGLRDLHRAPFAACPFDFRLDAALAHVERRVATGDIDPTGFNDEHRDLSPEEGLELLRRLRPPEEDLVVCHGDYCFPNVILDGWWKIVGFVDLGELGVADRWWDLAVATWSTTWNIGPGWEETFLRAYGIDLDPDRTFYYRLLYDLAS